MMVKRCLSIILVLLLITVSFAEELGEIDLYAPEIYRGEVATNTESIIQPDVEYALPGYEESISEQTYGMILDDVDAQLMQNDTQDVVDDASAFTDTPSIEITYSVYHLLIRGDSSDEDVMIADPDTYSATAGTVIRGDEVAMPERLYPQYEGLEFRRSGNQGELMLEEAGENRLEVYYTLPLSVTVEDVEKAYSGEEQQGVSEFTVIGQLPDTELGLEYEAARGIEAGVYEGAFSGQLPAYYEPVSLRAGKLTITGDMEGAVEDENTSDEISTIEQTEEADRSGVEADGDGQTDIDLETELEYIPIEDNGEEFGSDVPFSSGSASSGDGLYDKGKLGWRLYINNKFASYYNGLYYDKNVGWWLVQSGQIAFGYTGLYNDQNVGWWLVQGGQIAFGYTGLFYDQSIGWWLVQGGQIAFDYNGLFYDQNVGWWLVQGGQIAFGYNGLYKDQNVGWWLVQGGQIAFGYTGLYYDQKLGWRLVQGGQLASKYNGLYYDQNVGWWLVQSGKIAFGYSGLYKDKNVGRWLVQGGQIDFGYNGLYYDQNMGWRLIQGGQIASKYNGLYYDQNVGWWMVRAGAIDFGYYGLYDDQNVGLWLVQGGQIDFGYNGLYYDQNMGWRLVQGGQIAFGYTGLYNDQNVGWWLIQGGEVAFGYNGLYNDQYVGCWLVKGGTIAFDYTGTWNDANMGKQSVKNGKAQIKPATPKNVTATGVAAGIQVKWSASSGATGYKVYYGTSSFTSNATEYGSILSSGTTSVTITGLKEKQKYYAWVKATSPDGDSDYSSRVNAITLPGSVAVTGISLNKTSLSLNVRDEKTLTATIKPSTATNKVVTWSSSDDSIATVVNGLVTAKGEGQCTITAKTEDGGKTATCKVTVTKASISRTGSFSKSSVTLSKGSKTTVTISGKVTNSTLAAVTVNGAKPDGSGLSSIYNKTSWNGASSFSGVSVTIDATSSGAFNQPGTYTLKLWVRDVDTATLPSDGYVATMKVIVEEVSQPVSRTGSFSKSSITLSAGSKTTVTISGKVTNSTLAAVTVNGTKPDGNGLSSIYNEKSWNGASSFSGVSVTIDATSSGAFNQPGTYTLKLWVRDVDTATLPSNGYVATMKVKVEGTSEPSFTVSFPDKTLFIGDKWIADAKVTVSGGSGYVGKVTIAAYGYTNSTMSDNFSGHMSSSIRTGGSNGNGYAAYTIDTSKAPWNVPGTYTLRLWALDSDGNKTTSGTDKDGAIASMTLEIEERILSYDSALPLPLLSGTSQDKLIQVAKSQIGYTEKGDNMTVYGAFTGTNGNSWCAPFVSWCASKAGLSSIFKTSGTYANPDNVLKSGYSVWYFALYSSWKSENAAPGKGFSYFISNASSKTYDSERTMVFPQKGDLIFFATSDGSPWAHIGMIEEYDSSSKIITYIDGNGTSEGDGTYNSTLVAGKKGNIAVSEWRLSLQNKYICAIARPNY